MARKLPPGFPAKKKKGKRLPGAKKLFTKKGAK
jgi:hypothetical protein